MRSRWKSFAVLSFLAVAAQAAIESGMSLSDALLELRRQGVELVFSSRVVTPEMRVTVRPSRTNARRAVDEILAPHGLAVAEGPGGVWIVVKRAAAAPPVERPILVEEIVVQPSRVFLLTDDPSAPTTFTREEIQALPHLGNDALRTLGIAPGTSSTDTSAEVHVRGSRRDELLVLLDGQELYEPYHLRDFDNALSVIDAASLESAELITAAFPARWGDRGAGVLNLTTIESDASRLNVEASFAGLRVDAGGANWLAGARRGSTDLLGKVFGLEQPRFWDFFGKVRHRALQLRALITGDTVRFDGDDKHLDTRYDSAYVWLTHRMTRGTRAFADSAASLARLRHRRDGEEDDDERAFEVEDRRHARIVSLAQTWNVQAAETHLVTAGAEVQQLDATYNYFSAREFDTPLAALRAEPRDGELALEGDADDRRVAIHLADHIRPLPSLGLDLGVRVTRYADERTIDPRIATAWRAGAAGVVRVAWGRFSQSQRPHELMIEDADTRIYPVERSSQWVVGYERLLRKFSLRAEVHRRAVRNPRPRYENLFKTFDPFPEGEIDRVRIEPERSEARGVELSLRGRASARFGWWLNYAWSRTTDRLDGRDVPRRIDQTHAVNADLDYRLGEHWRLNAALRYHTGWPVTPLLSAEPRTGPMNSARVDDYRRIDLRVSREWRRVTGFVDVQNLLNRRNVAGLDANIEDGVLVVNEEHWPGFVMSAGVIWKVR